MEAYGTTATNGAFKNAKSTIMENLQNIDPTKALARAACVSLIPRTSGLISAGAGRMMAYVYTLQQCLLTQTFAVNHFQLSVCGDET